MSAATSQKPSLLKALALTKRDLRLFACSGLLFAGIAAGAIALAQPAHGQTSAPTICSADKFFR